VLADRVCCRNNTSEIESFRLRARLRGIVAVAGQEGVDPIQSRRREHLHLHNKKAALIRGFAATVTRR